MRQGHTRKITTKTVRFRSWQTSSLLATLVLIVTLLPSCISKIPVASHSPSSNASDTGLKFVLVTGGMVNGISKSGVSGSIGSLLKDANWDVRSVSISVIQSMAEITLTPLKEQYDRGQRLTYVIAHSKCCNSPVYLSW